MFRTRLLALLIFVLAAPGAVLAAPPVWVVRDADSTIVLFGSVHLLPRDLDWRPQVLTETLPVADDVWFEIPMDANARLESSRLAMARGLLPKGESLSNLLDKKAAARLHKVATGLNIPIRELDTLQPWLAEVTLSLAQIAKYGGRTDSGVEDVLWNAAPSTAQRRSFETPEGQISLFADVPRSLQITSLNDTVRTIEEDPKDFEKVVSLWMAGDVDGLVREAILPIKKVSPKLYQSFIQNRNAAWTKALTARLAGSGRTVVVVGVGHLVGPDSVPAMLRARGVKVEGP